MIQCIETIRLFIDGTNSQPPFSPRLVGDSAVHSLAKQRRKVYVVHDGAKYLYVGDAATSMLERLRRGFRAFNKGVADGKARGGYWGYKWVGKYAAQPDVVLTLYVAVLDEDVDPKREAAEVIEAELVYLIRSKKGYWPICQREIHFSNYANAAEDAERVFEYVEEMEGLKRKAEALRQSVPKRVFGVTPTT